MFALYPERRHFWSLDDYGAVLSAMQACNRVPFRTSGQTRQRSRSRAGARD